MLSQIIFLSWLLAFTIGEPTIAGIDRTLSEGVSSMGYNIMYADEDLTMFNMVVDEVEKKASKAKIKLNELIQPLPTGDVKCLMSADHYCSKDMKETKSVIIQAIKDDCKECSTPQKENAGRVIAAMMAHDPAAWKLFLTRIALLVKETYKTKREASKPESGRYKPVGEPEEVVNLRANRFILPGAKVRVKRYTMEKVME